MKTQFITYDIFIRTARDYRRNFKLSFKPHYGVEFSKKNYLFGSYEVFKISLKEINVSIIPFFYFNGCLWFFWEGYHSVYVKKAHGLPTKDEA